MIGDPLDDQTDLGPMLNDGACQRIDSWIAEAVAGGASVIAGGQRDGQLYQATVIEGAQPDMKVMREEVFGPVVCLLPFDDFEQALDAVNDSPFGLQAGVYTRDLNRALLATQKLNVGGVMINDVPTFRVDQMPYGGMKDSGVGREGPRFAIEEMTNLKMVVISTGSVIMADQPKEERGITAIAVSGFKSLRDESRIEIRNLTVLAGANSSGKSSIMQPLLLLKQTLEAPYDPGAR